MTKNAAFWRKVTYLAVIAILFVPISRLSATATTEDEGGILSQMRADMELSPAQLGKIDPASASMSLATLGLRGVAANLLWGQAFHYKKTDNFDALMATLGQIAKLQPNFVSVWQHQAWNISYNASVEFDDYRHRYEWVKKGLDFLMEGITYNRNEPLLLWDAGWFFGHKLGRADEAEQFRRLFRHDDDFHRTLPIDLDKARGPDGLPDNWLVAHQWFNMATDVVDSGASISRLAMHYILGDQTILDKKQTAMRGKNPLIFYSDPPKALINFAEAIQKDGYLDEVSLIAWRTAARAWEDYGQRPILSSFGLLIRLNEMESRDQRADELEQQFEELVPGLRGELVQQRRQNLSAEERAVVDLPRSEVSADQLEVYQEAQRKLAVSLSDAAGQAPPDVRQQATQLATEAEANRGQAQVIGRYREIVNFLNWRLRCRMEQEPNTLEARKLVYDAEQAFDRADLERSRRLFEQAWDRWAEVFERFPEFVEDVEGEIVVESVIRYKRLLDQLGESFPPAGFKLLALCKVHEIEYPIIAPPADAVMETVDVPAEQMETSGDAPATEDDEQAARETADMPAEQVEASGDAAPAESDEQATEPPAPDTATEEEPNMYCLKHQVTTIDGVPRSLEDYRGKVVLVVNVASECGLTPQYEQLQQLHQKYADQGLAILGFPCNQFGRQEPGTATEIKEFCQKNYGVEFAMFSKLEVNGESADPLYQQLTALDLPPAGAGPISWNFEKFLIDRQGNVVARFSPRTRPDATELIARLEAELKTD